MATQRPVHIDSTSGNVRELVAGDSIGGITSVLYSGATSGVTTLQAPAVAGSAVVTLPAATGTLPTLEAANRFTAVNNRYDGYLGIGGAADANAILNLGGANPLTGAVQVGTLCALVGTSAATTAIRGHQMACRTAAAAFTCSDVWNYYTGANVAGAGSTITRSAKFVAYRDLAATNNLGYYYGSALTWVGNWCLYMDAAYDSYLGTGNVGIGTTTISAKVHAVSTTEQLRLGYDASNYLSTTVSSAGLATLATTGTNASITLTPSGTGNVILSKIPRFNGTNSTGAGSSLLGANSPATTLTAPYTWISVITSDGSTAYIPCWK